jgi:hypothetical protein
VGGLVKSATNSIHVPAAFFVVLIIYYLAEAGQEPSTKNIAALTDLLALVYCWPA